MKTLPIIFSQEMLPLILSGRKTQERRVLKGSPRYEGVERLWVREIFRKVVREYMFDESPFKTTYFYKANYEQNEANKYECPPLYMPKEAARTWLQVKTYHTDTLWNISEENAIAEGVSGRDEYFALWDSLNTKRGYPTCSNPWVEVIEFEVEKEINSLNRG